MVGLARVVVPEGWAEVDPQEGTCSRGLEIGSVPTREYLVSRVFTCDFSPQMNIILNLSNDLSKGAVETRTLPGGWSVTSAKLPSQKG